MNESGTEGSQDPAADLMACEDAFNDGPCDGLASLIEGSNRIELGPDYDVAIEVGGGRFVPAWDGQLPRPGFVLEENETCRASCVLWEDTTCSIEFENSACYAYGGSFEQCEAFVDRCTDLVEGRTEE